MTATVVARPGSGPAAGDVPPAPRPRPSGPRALAAWCGVALLVPVLVLVGAGWRGHVMTTPSMGPTAPVGSLVLSRPATAADLHVGDVAVVHPPGRRGATFVHRVVARAGAGTALTLRTRGDIDGAPDPWTVRAPDVAGRVVAVVPVAGLVLRLLPAGTCGLLLVLLAGAGRAPATRRAVRVLGASLVVAAELAWYRPLVGVVVIARTVDHGRGTAALVSTGVLPVRVRAGGGGHVDLLPGHVGVVGESGLRPGQVFHLQAAVHLSGAWWLLLLVWTLPLLAGWWPRRRGGA